MKNNIENSLIKYLRSLIFRIMGVTIIFLALAIVSKTNKEYKDKIVSNVYEKNISFAKIKKMYYKYLGGITPIDNLVEKEISVFSEKLSYDEESIYHDGVKLTVGNNYLIPALKEGIVVYIGEKENYGNVIIIEDIDGINIWYGNIASSAVKLYDYVKPGTYLGSTKDNYLYLVYEKDSKFLNYKDYLP